MQYLRLGSYTLHNLCSWQFSGYIHQPRTYIDIVAESLNYCINHTGLTVFGYIIMSNHIHLIIQAKQNNLSDMLRDLKKYTSQRIIQSI